MPVYTEEERTDRLLILPLHMRLMMMLTLALDLGSYSFRISWIDGHLATQFCRDFLNAGPDFATSYRSIWKYDLPKGFAAAGSRLPCPTLILGGGADRIATCMSVLGPFFRMRMKYLCQKLQTLLQNKPRTFCPYCWRLFGQLISNSTLY